MTPRKLIPILLVVGLVVAAIWTRGFGLLPAEKEPLQLYGNVDVREVDLAFRVGGRIAHMPVEEGVQVKAGTVLATLDRTPLDDRANQASAEVARASAQLDALERGSRSQDISAARARVAAATAALAAAQADYDRRAPLVEPGAISRALWQQTEASRDRAAAQLNEARASLSAIEEGPRVEEIEAARASLKAAQAAQSSISTDLSDTRLVASEAGTVLTRAREPGAIVAPGETVVTLSIARPVRVRAYVAEGRLSDISPGMDVTVTADGNATRYNGKVAFISPRAEFTPKTVETADLRTDLVYRIRIIIEDSDGRLRQGQPVTVDVPASSAATKN